MVKMNMKRLGAIAGAVLVSGALLTGGAMAANLPSKLADKLQSQVQAGKITQNQADVVSQLFNLRQSAMTKLKADEKALIDQAVKDGKLTQAQADQLAKRGDHFGEGNWQKGGAKGDRQFFDKNMTADQLKAKLDTAVKAGKLTQEKADQILQRFQNRGQSHQQGQTDSKPQAQSKSGQ
jgi:polyhydroxyalkanoate synthesis regulator phasin